jgi:hypothetical protein
MLSRLRAALLPAVRAGSEAAGANWLLYVPSRLIGRRGGSTLRGGRPRATAEAASTAPGVAGAPLTLDDMLESSAALGAAAGDCMHARALTGACASSSLSRIFERERSSFGVERSGLLPRGAWSGSADGAVAGPSLGDDALPRADIALLRGLVSAPHARRGLDSRRAEFGALACGEDCRRVERALAGASLRGILAAPCSGGTPRLSLRAFAAAVGER